VCSHLEQHRVEADRVGDPLDDCALEVVVEQVSRHAAEGFECVDVPTQKTRHACVEEEAKEDLAREAEHDDEGQQLAYGSADLHRAESAEPVRFSVYESVARVQTGRRPSKCRASWLTA
jgi:hypothetical protein